MVKLARALIIECPKKTVSMEVFWSVFALSLVSVAYFVWGTKVALLVLPFPLIFWARYEIAATQMEQGEVVIGWWHAQVHLYDHGHVKDSIPLKSIISVAWLPRPNKLVSAARAGTIIISSKTGVYVNPVGPLPNHVVTRVVQFVVALQNKVDQFHSASESAAIESI